MIDGQMILLIIALVLAVVGLAQSNWRGATAAAVVVLIIALLLPHIGVR